ncbi:MAG: hypothetical protein II625_00935 [Bacilli bacterium]|nr:hypothetical protein [Bacilli bacterium]
MFIQELSCLEVLLNHLINDTDLNREIFTDFSSTKTFNNKRSNLFNIVSINNLIANYHEPAPFDLDTFVRTGVIKGVYEKPTVAPIIDPKDQRHPERFIRNIIEAFKEDNYILDDDSSVYVSSEKVEASLPEAWLYRLSEGFKRKKFQKLYFYNKHEEADISDKISLIDYLRHTKSFLVSLSSNTRTDYDVEFAKAEVLTNADVKDNPIVRVEELIKTFKSKIPKEYKVEIDRYKLSDLFFIVKRAEEAGQEFYTKPLEEQKKDINNWFIEFINSNARCNESAQEYLLLGEAKEKREIIIGLINQYFDLLEAEEIDFNEISLTDLKISAYIPENLQQSLEDRKTLVQAINRLRKEKADVKRQIDDYKVVLDTITVTDEQFKDIKARLTTLIEKYHIIEQEETKYQKTCTYLQDSVREEQKDSMLDISFANNEIIKQIINAVKYGRVYLNNNGTQVTFESYNNQVGKTTFKATINIRDLLTLIENINFALKDGHKNTKY